jgi:hypothetical protein
MHSSMRKSANFLHSSRGHRNHHGRYPADMAPIVEQITTKQLYKGLKVIYNQTLVTGEHIEKMRFQML